MKLTLITVRLLACYKTKVADLIPAAQNPEEMEPAAPPRVSFLMEDDLWQNIGSRQIHDQECQFLNRYRITCPSKLTNSRGLASFGAFAIQTTNKKSQVVHDIVDVKHLSPGPAV